MTAHVWSEEALRQAFKLKASLAFEIDVLDAFCLPDDAVFENVKPMIGAMLDAALEVDSDAITKEATYAERDRCVAIADKISAYEVIDAILEEATP